MRDYQLLVTPDRLLALVNVGNTYDKNMFVGRTTSPILAILHDYEYRTRLYRDCDLKQGFYLLTYNEGNTTLIVNPSLGDYVPPNYEAVSDEVNRELQSTMGRTYLRRSEVIPLEGEILINPNVLPRQMESLRDGNPCLWVSVVGWTFPLAAAIRQNTILYREGLYIERNSIHLPISQRIKAEYIRGATSIIIEIEEHQESNREVRLGGKPLDRVAGHQYVWEGPPIKGDTDIAVYLNEVPLTRIHPILVTRN